MKKGSFLTEHLHEINKSYFVHFKDAFYYGLRLLIGGLAAIIHAIFPFLFEQTGGDEIEKINNDLQHRRNNERKLD